MILSTIAVSTLLLAASPVVAGDVESIQNAISSLRDSQSQQEEVVMEKRRIYEQIEAKTRLAERALKYAELPMSEARERYRKAQQMSLEYPEVSTENERLGYLEAKKQVMAATTAQRAEVDQLRAQLAQARDNLEMAERIADKTRRDMDTLGGELEHADAVLRPVAD
ncbi:hypothetical protein MAIT1_01092 [Magnetofaba australis IT-1]|uniref:Uncharacterized protein n=2 Tax=Magnetofaba TaxID=1472292 RepID=A0A1Y2K7Z8_9PROT|nr:hypothetical protein MAIT1_01092 [Magnetofaba australis IT-1]